MKKKSKDPGLVYLQSIGFERIRGRHGLIDRWNKVFGKTKAEELYKERQKYKDGSIEFYEFKNSDPEISKSFSESYDGDIIRKACNYIDSHKEYFGSTILEVGCDAGYMTVFLAKEFPNSKIVSIDRSLAATNIASQRISSAGINNVEIRNCSLQDVSEKFDTVFCMRTIQENIDSTNHPYEGDPIIYQVQEYSKLTDPHTSNLIDRINDSGFLCVFERVGHDPLMCGWLYSLNEKEWGIIVDSYSEIVCEEVEERSTFQAFACMKNMVMDRREVFRLWYQAIGVDPTGKGQLEMWPALSYLCDNAGCLIYGIRVINDEGDAVGRFALFSDCDNETLIYLLWSVGEDIKLLSNNINCKEEAIEHIKSAAESNRKIGLTIKEIDPNEETLEGNLKLQDI